MKLYYAPRTRAGRSRWLLEELGVPYELVTLQLQAGEHKTPAYMEVQPLGVVPALQDGDVTVYESAAICLYLADKFPEKKLAPPLGTPARALYYQWILFATTTFEERLIAALKAPDDAEARDKFAAAASVVERALGEQPFLLSHMFTAADVVMGAVAGWAVAMRMLEAHPRLQAYAMRLRERPACVASRKD